MNYGNIKKTDIADGPGVRVSLFVSGCTHHCKECFQPETWDFSYGTEFDDKVRDEIIEMLRPSYISGLTVLGGEPWVPDNQCALLPFIEEVRRIYPEKTIWMYSGYTYEELKGESRARCECTDKILALIDVLVDGEFMIDKKDISLSFRGSSNQRIIDMKETGIEGKVVLAHIG